MSKKQIGNLTNEIFMQSALDNKYTWEFYLMRLMDIAVSLFRWEGLPDSSDVRWLERSLFCRGYCLYFHDEVMGDLTLPCTIGGRLDVYNIPVDRTAYASNGYLNQKTAADSVLIYNNQLHTSEIFGLANFAKRLYLLDRIIDINVNAQKTPIMIICDENQRLTMKNLYQKYEGNAPYIFGNKQLAGAPIQALNTNAPFLADKLYQLRTDIWNEALSFMGISNLSVQKKERMISDEVQRMNAGSIAARYSKMMAREDACNKINKMFSQNVSVALREDIDGADLNPPEKTEGKPEDANSLEDNNSNSDTD